MTSLTIKEFPRQTVPLNFNSIPLERNDSEKCQYITIAMIQLAVDSEVRYLKRD